MSEKLCLQWNDFKENAIGAFESLRGDADFADVTLACEDGEQVEAHKVILAASSPFFQSLLGRIKHPHPLIYMRGMKSEDLLAIVDFIYCGEANVIQENLDSFFAIAEELQLKGLMGQGVGDLYSATQKEKRLPRTEPTIKRESTNSPSAGFETTNENDQMPQNEQDLDEKIKNNLEKKPNVPANGKKWLYACKVCGKEGEERNMKRHIESKHLEGVSFSCNLCEKPAKSRNALQKHKAQFHAGC